MISEISIFLRCQALYLYLGVLYSRLPRNRKFYIVYDIGGNRRELGICSGFTSEPEGCSQKSGMAHLLVPRFQQHMRS